MLRRQIISAACSFFLGVAVVLADDYIAGETAYNSGDYPSALRFLRPLAESGNGHAQILIGSMYENGQGVAADIHEAVRWYELAGEQGHPLVQFNLGLRYFNGQGVAQDYQQAFNWWSRAAEAGIIDANFNLGLMYYRGLAVPRDYSRAKQLFIVAAEQDHAQAQYSLAVMYAFAQGGKENHKKAFQLFAQSAKQGVAQAQFNLGMLYANGLGTQQDMVKARTWVSRAAAQGLSEADAKLHEWQASVPVSETKTAPLSTHGWQRNAWLAQQSANLYTLQLASVLLEAQIIEFIKAKGLSQEATYLMVKINDTTRYVAIYGLFDTHEKAQQAAQKLYGRLGIKPWVRNIGKLQELLK